MGVFIFNWKFKKRIEALFLASVDLWSSTSFPGGDQVDGLPPAPSNATGDEERPKEANIFVARGCFKHVVLRIQTSEFNEIAREPTRGIRQGSATSSGDPTSRILRSTDGQVSSHDGIIRISSLDAVRQGPVDVPGPKSLR